MAELPEPPTVVRTDTPVRADASVQEMMQMMDVANALRAQQKEVEKVLTRDEQIADLKERLGKTYQSMGTQVDDATLTVAIQKHFSDQYRFQEPPRDFTYRLATAYVDRRRLGKVYGIPALVLSLIAGGSYAGVKINHSVQLARAEAKVEQLVEENYRERAGIFSRLSAVSSSPLLAELPSLEKQEVESSVSNSRRQLATVEQFFTTYAPEGNAERKVTPTNFDAVDKEILGVVETMQRATGALSGAERVIQSQQTYVDIRRDLDATIGAVRASHPEGVYAKKTEAVYAGGIKAVQERRLEKGKEQLGMLTALVNEERSLQETETQLDLTLNVLQQSKAQEFFVERGESLYQKGKKAVEARQVTPAQEALQQLSALQRDAGRFTVLEEKLSSTYSSVTQVVREEKARQKAEDLYREAQGYLRMVSAAQLESAVSELQGLEQQLNLEYQIRIVSRPGEQSGGDRLYEERGKPTVTSGLFLYVEAWDRNGRRLEMDITNVENGNTERVSKWGEAVPQSVFERVVADKRADGTVDDNVIGSKRKGYLSSDYEKKFEVLGKKITKWEEY